MAEVAFSAPDEVRNNRLVIGYIGGNIFKRMAELGESTFSFTERAVGNLTITGYSEDEAEVLRRATLAYVKVEGMDGGSPVMATAPGAIELEDQAQIDLLEAIEKNEPIVTKTALFRHQAFKSRGKKVPYVTKLSDPEIRSLAGNMDSAIAEMTRGIKAEVSKGTSIPDIKEAAIAVRLRRQLHAAATSGLLAVYGVSADFLRDRAFPERLKASYLEYGPGVPSRT